MTEAVNDTQKAIAALNITQQAKQLAVGAEAMERESNEPRSNTALIVGVRKFAVDVRELDIDLIDEAVERIRDGSITNVVYDPQTASLGAL